MFFQVLHEFTLNLLANISPVEMTVAAHDTTGGMATKIGEAAMIAKLGIDVYIVKVNAVSSNVVFCK